MPAKPRKLRPYRFRKRFYLNPSGDGPKLDYPLEVRVNRIDYTSKDSYRAIFNTNNALENNYSYEDLSDVTDYTIQDGDYLEYDIKWTNKDSHIGFNYECIDGVNRLRGSGLVDQNNLGMDLKDDISARSFNRWYHRKSKIPYSHIGKTIHRYEIGFDRSYENIRAVSLNTTTMWTGICVTPDNDVYATANSGYIYKRKAGSLEFNPVWQTPNTTTADWRGICSDDEANVYAIRNGGKVWKLNRTTGNFEEQASVTSRSWRSITYDGGYLYASVDSGFLYYRLASDTGDFTQVTGSTARTWTGACHCGTTVYGCVWGGEIYKIVDGVGVEVSCGAGSRNWGDINTNGTYVYAVAQGPGDIYVKDRTGATDTFSALGLSTKDWGCIAVDSNENLYTGVASTGGELYYKPCGYSKTTLIPDSPSFNYITGDDSDYIWGTTSDFDLETSTSKIYKQTEYGFEVLDTHSSYAFKGYGYLGLHLDSDSTVQRFLYFCEDQHGICHKTHSQGEILSKTDEYKSGWWDVWVTPTGTVYATVVPRQSDGTYESYFTVYKKNAGSSTWIEVANINRPAVVVQEPSSICVDPTTNDVYVFDKKYGRLYRQLIGVGAFSLVVGVWSGTETTAGGLFADHNGHIYLCTDTDVYKRDHGTGLWTAQGLGGYGFKDIWVSPITNIIFGAGTSGVYKITPAETTPIKPLGTGTFNDWASWADTCVDSDGSVYLAVINGGTYKRYRGDGHFVSHDSTSRNWKLLTSGTVGGTEYIYGIIDGAANCLYRSTVGTSTFSLAPNQPVSATNIWKGLNIDSSGNIYTTDSQNKVFKSSGGAFSLFYTSPGTVVGTCITPKDHIYICNTTNVYISTDGSSFSLLQTIGTSNKGIVNDSHGNVFIYDNTGTNGRTIYRKGDDEVEFTEVGKSFMLWNRLTIDSNDNIYGIATRGNVFKFKWNFDQYQIGFIKNVYITDGSGTTRKEILVGTESSMTTYNTRHSMTFNPTCNDTMTAQSVDSPSTHGGWTSMGVHPNGDVYITRSNQNDDPLNSGIWVQREGIGHFTKITLPVTLCPWGVACSPFTGWVYLACWNWPGGTGGIYVNRDPLNDPANFEQITSTDISKNFDNVVVSPVTGNVYAISSSTDLVYVQIGEPGISGTFTAASNNINNLDEIDINFDGRVYASQRGGGLIYYANGEPTSPVVFSSLTTNKVWSGVRIAPNGDLFASVSGDYIWTKQRESSTLTLTQIIDNISDLNYWGLVVNSNWDLYLCTTGSSGVIYSIPIHGDGECSLHSFNIYPPEEVDGVINVDENKVNSNFSDIRFTEVDGISIMDHCVTYYDEVLKYGLVLVKFSYIFSDMGTTDYWTDPGTGIQYTIRTFPAGDGVFATVKDGTVDYLLVGGGGGSGGWCTGLVGSKRYEGGGGGGEVLEFTSVSLPQGRYSFHVGEGGVHVDSQHEPGDHLAIGVNDGIATTFNGETARGGHGGYYDDSIVKHDHGGNSGNGQLGSTASYGSGGAGAGGPGFGGTEKGHSGNGGVGVTSDITGATVYYGGGGAGGHWIALGTHGLGTIGGGGTGLFNPHPELGEPTSTWTPPHLPGNDGADGTLIIRYPTLDQLETDETYPSFYMYYSWPGPVGPPREGTTSYWTDPGTGIEYTIRTFTENAHFYPCRSGRIDYLIVGGGGGAGGFCNGAHADSKYEAGGGGGEVIESVGEGIEPGTYDIIVGQGGPNNDADHQSGYDGTYSSFLGVTAAGGGRGISSYLESHGTAYENVPYSHDRGGSCGDGLHFGFGAPGHPDFASLIPPSTSTRAWGSGGAGAGEHGSRGTNAVKGGKGGDGLPSTITGSIVYYGGGGGGGHNVERGDHGLGTIGGGGTGCLNPGRHTPPDVAGQDGADGIVIIRYRTSERLEEYREDPSDPDAVFDEGLRYWYFSSTTGTPTPVTDPVTNPAQYRGTDVDAAVLNHSWTRSDPIIINGNSWETEDPAQVIWYGWILTPMHGTYTISVSHDDGIKLWLNDVLVINQWVEHEEIEHSYTLTVNSDTLPIKLQYFANGKTVEAVRLYWTPPDGSGKALIPLSNLRCTTNYSSDPPTFRSVGREERLVMLYTIPI